MAWLNNLAEKAEYFLDRLDHKASVVLLQNERKDNEAQTREKDVAYYNDFSINLMENLLPHENVSSNETVYNITSNDIFEEKTVIPTRESKCVHNQENYDKSETDLSTTDSYLGEYNNQKHLIQELERRNAEQLTEYSNCLEEIAELRKTLQEYKNKNKMLNSQIKETVSSLTLTQKEVEKHRKQAENNLEDKEKLIASAENAMFVKNKPIEPNEYILKLIKARDEQQKKIVELNEKLETMQNDLIITQKYCSMYKEETCTIRQNLQKEQKIRLNLEDELVNNKQEINKLYEDLKMHINLLNSKNETLANLQKQVDTQYTATENDEIESKFHVLTKTLIMKQNSLETLTTERNALRLQLERLKADYARVLTELNMKQKSIQSHNFEENGKSPDIFDIAPFNESLSQRVKRTITTLNSFSIRLGVFLRRYPVARIFLLCYMILLQIWVVVILFAYVPNSN